MFRIISSSGNSVVANGDLLQENTMHKTAVPDALRKTELTVKTLLADDLSVFMIGIKCAEQLFLNFELSKGHKAICFIQTGAIHLHHQEGISKKIDQNTYYNLPDQDILFPISVNADISLCLICLKQNIADKLLSADASLQWPSSTSAPIGPAMAGVLHTIVRHAGEGSFHRIMMIAKTLELLFMSLGQLAANTDGNEPPAIRSVDREKLEAARNLVSRDLQSPYSLVELAHKVGLNDFKLKKGFKELYGTTVFGYLTDLRMQKAKRMIASGQYSIGEIAHEVGYKNGHHFTVAFKKKFGHVPSKPVAIASA